MKCLAITIGPIYKTFEEAKRTRAVWASSYFFSWFIRRILEEAMKKKMNVFLPDTSVMTNSGGNYEGEKGKYGSGLYADRLYFVKDDKNTKDTLLNIVEDLKKEVEELSKNAIKGSFLDDYLIIHIIEKTISDEELKDDYPLAILNRLLDNKELQKNYNFDYENNQLQNYFSNNATAKDSFLAADAFGNSNDRKFKSISEIATTSLLRTNREKYLAALNKDLKSKEDTNFIDEVKEQGIELCPRHKYYAVIYADGDNIGSILKEINEKNIDIKTFSKTLFDFGKKTEEAIYKYGGNGIYLGGEDILCFVPITCVDENDKSYQKTIFELIKNIDIAFEDTVIKYADDKSLTTPSMSYGVMISYYKHPLKEAMHNAFDLLELVKAGKFDNGTKKYPDKNSIAIRFKKHSGQYVDAVIEKKNVASTKEIYKLIESYCSKPKTKQDKTDEILSSIIQRFRDDVYVKLYFESINNKNLDAFFENFFNEDIHKQTDKAKFLTEVKTLSGKIYKEYNDAEKTKNILFLVLRFIQFVNSTK